MKNLVTLCAVALIAGCSLIKPNPGPPPTPIPVPTNAPPHRPPMPPALTKPTKSAMARKATPKAVAAPSNVTLAWDYSLAANPGISFRLYSGASSHNYTNSADAGTNLTTTAPATAPTNYYAVTARDTNGLESPFSNEAVYALPLPPTNVVYLTVLTNSSPTGGTWGVLTNLPPMAIGSSNLFYRLLISLTPH